MARRGGRPWRNVRATVLARDQHTCVLRIHGVCIGRATTVDHVIPVAVWPEGEYVASNLVAACRPCNRRKSTKITGWRSPTPDEIDPYTL